MPYSLPSPPSVATVPPSVAARTDAPAVTGQGLAQVADLRPTPEPPVVVPIEFSPTSFDSRSRSATPIVISAPDKAGPETLTSETTGSETLTSETTGSETTGSETTGSETTGSETAGSEQSVPGQLPCSSAPTGVCQPSDRLPSESVAPAGEPVSPPAAQPTPEPSATPATESIAVQSIHVTDSTILTENDIQSLTQPLVGKTVSLEALRQVADKITQLYLDRGFITSRAILDPQTIRAGVVQIRVLEGSLERIEIEGTHRLSQNYVRSRIQLGAGKPLNVAKLEDQLRLLKADPLLTNVEARLRAGTQPAQSILIVRVTEAGWFEGGANVDSFSPPSVGLERFGGNVGVRNLTGLGDRLFGYYNRSTTGGAENYGVAYQVPLNAREGTLQLRADWNRNKITQDPFDALNIRGKNEQFAISYRQPLVRSPREEFAVSLGLTYQNGQTFSFNTIPTPFGLGPDKNGVSRTSVILFGQDYVRRDPNGAWSARSEFSFGTGWFNATRNSGDVPDGQFFSWLGQIQRVQRLGNSNLLIVQGDLQLTPDELLPAQQFVIGGGQSVRGYRQNARSGDNGIRFSVEDRMTILRDANGSPTLQLAPFAEVGAVWNARSNPNLLPRQTVLPTIGLGLLWQPLPRLSLRLDYGVPLVKLNDRTNNFQDKGFAFSVNYQI